MTALSSSRPPLFRQIVKGRLLGIALPPDPVLTIGWHELAAAAVPIRVRRSVTAAGGRDEQSCFD